MELGATICVPRKPLCLLCPLKRDCLGRPRAEEFPVKTRTATVKRVETIAILQHGDRFYCEQVPEGKPWHGLWRFPDFDPARMVEGEEIATHPLRHHEVCGDDAGRVGALAQAASGCASGALSQDRRDGRLGVCRAASKAVWFASRRASYGSNMRALILLTIYLLCQVAYADAGTINESTSPNGKYYLATIPEPNVEMDRVRSKSGGLPTGRRYVPLIGISMIASNPSIICGVTVAWKDSAQSL